MTQWFHHFSLLPVTVRLLLLIFIFLFSFGTIIHYIEPTNYPSLFDGVWWAIITMATVGYGDFTPKTTEGKIITMIMILTGGAFMAHYMATIASIAVRKQNEQKKGKKALILKNHIVFIGWNERTKLLCQFFHNDTLLLIDETVQVQPMSLPSFYFLKGTPYFDETLQKATIQQAKAVFITADQYKPEKDADNQTILTILAVRGFSSTLPIFAEILTADQQNNAIRAGATQILSSNETIASTFSDSFLKYTNNVNSI